VPGRSSKPIQQWRGEPRLWANWRSILMELSFRRQKAVAGVSSSEITEGMQLWQGSTSGGGAGRAHSKDNGLCEDARNGD
jgi:hypothetical protein